MKNALIIVDVQQDFCPGGALPAPKGNNIIPVINELIGSFDYVLASKDWHPEKTIHFEKWPSHCIKETEGAAFHPQLNESAIDEVALKGTTNKDDGYSAFEATNLNVTKRLKAQQVVDVYICGLTTEYCVKATALDAHKAGFNVWVITDAIAAVEANEGDEGKALKELKNAGIKLVTSSQL